MANTEKTNTGLLAHAQKWVGQAYWYGTCCYPCTQSLLTRKAQQYPSYYLQSRMAEYQRDIAQGRSCADCVGLIKGYWWEQDGNVVYNASTDMNTTSMYNAAPMKGVISTLPEVPGLLVYKTGHMGVYALDGQVIEAKGFNFGIIQSKLAQTAWTHWLVSPVISYAGYEDKLVPKQDFPYTATVTTSASPLNIWQDTNKQKTLAQVKKGDTLTVVGNASLIGWYQVTKDGVTGVADGQYLTKV